MTVVGMDEGSEDLLPVIDPPRGPEWMIAVFQVCESRKGGWCFFHLTIDKVG